MMSARSQRRANMSGDKYVDALRRMGVEPDWRIQMAPEFLCKVQKEFMPVKTFDTSATNTGESTARYEGTLDVRCKRVKVAEHGYVIGVFALRPFLFNTAWKMPPDGTMTDIEDFFLADNLRSQDSYEGHIFGSASGTDIYVERFAAYRNGIHIVGADDEWSMGWPPTGSNPVGIYRAVFPEGNQLPVRS